MDAAAIGQKIRMYRGNRSTEEVAKELKISRSALSMYESGERVPKDDIKKKIAAFFGTTVGELFFDETR